MTTPEAEPVASDLPAGLSNPARQALTAAGYTRLEQLASVGENQLLALHGFGPKSLPLLRQALTARGLAFAETARSGSQSGARGKNHQRRDNDDHPTS